jgi:hypothetical protein
MPNPLFPFTWQYNNQPIEVLAATISEFVTNPTSKVLPVCADTANAGAGEFIDSTVWDTGQVLQTRYTNGAVIEDKGLELNYLGNKYSLGDYDGANNGTTVSVNDGAQTARFSATNTEFGIDDVNDTLTSTGMTATTAGAAAALFLKINVDSVDYKIQLYNV